MIPRLCACVFVCAWYGAGGLLLACVCVSKSLSAGQRAQKMSGGKETSFITGVFFSFQHFFDYRNDKRVHHKNTTIHILSLSVSVSLALSLALSLSLSLSLALSLPLLSSLSVYIYLSRSSLAISQRLSRSPPPHLSLSSFSAPLSPALLSGARANLANLFRIYYYCFQHMYHILSNVCVSNCSQACAEVL
jgi:hypothetical protein